MKSIDNGSVAVTFEWGAATVRAIDHIPKGPQPPYKAIAQIVRMSDTVAKLIGLCGEISRGHMWLLAQLLRDEGFKTLYATRTDAHVVPMAEYLTAGDFAGHWRLDLATMQDRRRKKRQPVSDLAVAMVPGLDSHG
ncbi:hypothetical protein U5817_10095 [Aromatoleum evansii]|uniref:Transposase n=1 Tax=Aromatoleum evansii TaxID=59406 RepID=A0ABZ1AR68_AROEV|nr:hypothetical protein U5817_09745 [Aromatoleum evansii]WRL48378.1 hypothetical protein U5817_10095 [Aromatoleum evansii]